MKHFRLLALGAFLLTTGLRALHAQEGGSPQDEIITDFGIDEYIYAPKLTLNLGMRMLSGAKSSFSGRGSVTTVQLVTDSTTPNILRPYYDGLVQADTRATIDSDGNVTKISPDGYTNTWSYQFASQIGADGNIAFHNYTANIIDAGPRDKSANSTMGVEVVVARDMGQLTKKIDWKLFAGMSLNDLNSMRTETVAANVTTVTDYYTLNGQTPPLPPYNGPSTGSSGVIGADGSITSTAVDNTTLLGSSPLARISRVTNGTVFNRWKVKGGYFTFRAGPSVTYAITEKLKATLSVGAALVFVGSTYTVEQIYKPEVGNDILGTVDSTTTKLLPGYYADATLEYDFTERAGAYAGAVYQSNGSYDQTIATTDANYLTKIDLASLSGFRMGMNFRF